MAQMILGVDFDNTIVSYDYVFHKVALERNLIPNELIISKGEVRRYLRGMGKETDWIELQGYVYGDRMTEARPFPSALVCLANWVRIGIKVFVVSHKTRHPYSGQFYDLHLSAWTWLENHGFFDRDRINMSRRNIFFELTKQSKINRIKDLKCTHFVDDLPELLTDVSFPAKTEKILFDTSRNSPEINGIRIVNSWADLRALIDRDRLRATV